MGFITKTARFALKAFQHRAWVLQRHGLLSAVLGALLIAITQGAYALNLGHLQINSRQGEPLKASIEIHSATPEELQGLSVRLYGQKDYEALNLNWENSLSKTTLQLMEGRDARLFVQIEGQEPVAQSFVELFFELRWNSGQVNRQIGLLLDPIASTPAPSVGQQAGNASIVVKPGDSASKLIEPFLEEGVSMDQMLLALLRNNPQSFINSNVNLLLSGSTLSVPSAKTATALKPKEAKAQVQAQHADFENYKKALVDKIKSSPSAELKSNQQKASGKVHDSKGSKSRSRDQLTLNAPKGPSPQELEKLSQEKAAQEQAQKLLELQNNIKELQAIREQEKGSALIKLWHAAMEGVQSQWLSSKEWAYVNAPALKTFAQWNLAPVVSGLFFALLVLLTAWRMQVHQARKNTADPTPAKSSSDPKDWRDENEAQFTAPSFEEPKHEAWRSGPEDTSRMNTSFAPATGLTQASDAFLSANDLTEQNIHDRVANPSTEPVFEDDRVKLAEDLWEIGQHHTAYAIAQEVYQQSTGREFERAKLWLESHAI